MSENMQMFLIGAAGLLVLIYGTVNWVWKGTSRAQRFREKAKQQGCVAQGFAVESKSRSGNEKAGGDDVYPIMTTKYRYRVLGKDYYIYRSKRLTPGSGANPPQINVYYKKNKPKKAISDGSCSVGKQQGHGCLLTIVATFAVMGILTRLFVALFGTL